MANIFCRPQKRTYVVTVWRNQQRYSKSFSWGDTRDQAQALDLAKAWLEALLPTLPPKQKLDTSNRTHAKVCRVNKTTCDRVGVDRIVTASYRTGRGAYLYFKVCWTTAERKRRTTHFPVGQEDAITPADERHAWRTALAFREHWEHCRDTNTPFDPAPYRDWRTVTCYPFAPSPVESEPPAC